MGYALIVTKSFIALVLLKILKFISVNRCVHLQIYHELKSICTAFEIADVFVYFLFCFVLASTNENCQFRTFAQQKSDSVIGLKSELFMSVCANVSQQTFFFPFILIWKLSRIESHLAFKWKVFSSQNRVTTATDIPHRLIMGLIKKFLLIFSINSTWADEA